MKNNLWGKIVSFLLLVILPSAIFIAGCQSNHNRLEDHTYNPIINSGKENFDVYSIFLDDSFIYFTFVSDDCVTFYRHYFKDNRVIEIGSVPNYVFNIGFHALIQDKLFFYITVAESISDVFEENKYENILYAIDIDKNTMEKISAESEYLPGAIIHSSGDIIVTRQSKRSDNNILTTFIELFDVNSGKVLKKSDEHILDDNTNIGSYIMNTCTYNNYIYALIDERFEDGTNEPDIYVFDNDFNLVRTINMGSVSDKIMAARVGTMEIYKDFVFMSNYSDFSFIGTIENDTIKPLIEEQFIDIALQYSEEYPPIFFVRGTNRVIMLDCENKKLEQIELKLPEEYMIQFMMSTEENAFITLFAYSETPDDDKHNLLYFLKRDALDVAQFNIYSSP